MGSPVEDDWMIIGPFKNRSGFLRTFPPEESIDLTEAFKGADREIYWQVASDGVYDGYVDLRELLRPSTWAVARDSKRWRFGSTSS